MARKSLLLMAALALIAGCVSKPETPSNAMTESDPVVQSLNDAAMRVARSAEQASLAKSVQNKKSRVTEEYRLDLSRVPQEMRNPLLLEGGFNGELDIFLKSITDAVGWASPVFLGHRPSTPLIVSFTEQRRPPAYWIADAGYQAGDMADITINSSLRQIIVTYREGRGERK